MKLETVALEPKGSPRPTPVLFIHGAFHGAWCWTEHFLPYFAEHGYTSYALSLRGHGNSEGRERLRRTRIADYVADVEQVVGELPKTPILVGHSMGGLIVQKYLEKHLAPAGVLLASVPIRGLLKTTVRIALRHPIAFLKANLTWSLYPIIGTPSLAREAFFSPDMPSDRRDSYFGRMQDESYFAFLEMMGLNLASPKKVDVPLLVLGGESDAFFSQGDIEATARAYKTQAELFPNMAHDMMLEPRWRLVADRILRWLRDQGL
jgi:pimeloyl-ACP methyl ester carboxylesterase